MRNCLKPDNILIVLESGNDFSNPAFKSLKKSINTLSAIFNDMQNRKCLFVVPISTVFKFMIISDDAVWKIIEFGVGLH